MGRREQLGTGRHCSDHAVEQWARTVLMSAAPWQHGAGPNNTKLAEAFNVRLDQVAQRRLELARRAGGSSPPMRRANATRRGDSGDHRLLLG
jgi:hypothetical protein